MSTELQPPRTYNQNHAPRKYTPGERRISIYWTWSYPWESNRDVTQLDNRFSTMTEVRRVAWPAYEGNFRKELVKSLAIRWQCSNELIRRGTSCR